MKKRLTDLRLPATGIGSKANNSSEFDIFELMVTAGMNNKTRRDKHIFQVAYDELHLAAQGRLLRLQGYTVTSICGNEAAKIVLRSRPHYDLFIVGHAAPEHIRIEIMHWLRATYPKAKILALNSTSVPLEESDYNASYDSPGAWLPLVAAAAA